MMTDHGQRAHATWSASATKRNWNCPGALTLAQQVQDLQAESEASAWGTAAHQVAERCLVDGFDAVEFIDRIEKTKEHMITVDEEMAETVQIYVDYVRERLASAPDAKLYVEQRFSLEKLKPPFDAGGTLDTAIYFPAQKFLEVIDFKGGRWVVVEVADNMQLRTYALCAMLGFPGLAVENIRSTIVQPRAGHKDGAIRSEDYHVVDLMEWTSDLLDAMNRSAEAQKAYAAVTGDLTKDVWAEKYLRIGDHCTFCPAEGFCPLRIKQAHGAVGLFDTEDGPKLSNMPNDLTPEQIADLLNKADMIEDHIKAVRALAKALAESGVEIPEYQLVEKVGRRKWKIEDEAALLAQLWVKTELDREQFYQEPKLKTPAMLEKLLGKKKKHLLADFVEVPVTGTSLVRTDSTDKPAVAPAGNLFTTIED